MTAPRELHPVFFGSFDWHSCVHGYWLLATLLRCFPELPEAARDREAVRRAAHAGEGRGRGRVSRAADARDLRAAVRMGVAADARGRAGSPRAPMTANAGAQALAPLDRRVRRRGFSDFLPKATYPMRVGTHFNTAFALALALEYAEVVQR